MAILSPSSWDTTVASLVTSGIPYCLRTSCHTTLDIATPLCGLLSPLRSNLSYFSPHSRRAGILGVSLLSLSRLCAGVMPNLTHHHRPTAILAQKQRPIWISGSAFVHIFIGARANYLSSLDGSSSDDSSVFSVASGLSASAFLVGSGAGATGGI